VIIGSGTLIDSRKESKTFKIGETGGEFNHLMTLEELVAHFHLTGSTGYDSFFGGGTFRGKYPLFSFTSEGVNVYSNG
jgi:hypothetical protein